MHGEAYDTNGSVFFHVGQGESYFDWNFARTETSRLLERDIVVYPVEIGSNILTMTSLFLNVSTSLQFRIFRSNLLSERVSFFWNFSDVVFLSEQGDKFLLEKFYLKKTVELFDRFYLNGPWDVKKKKHILTLWVTMRTRKFQFE